MFVHFLPLNVDGAADLSTGNIFLPLRLLGNIRKLTNSFIHELVHIITQSSEHDKEFRSLFGALGGSLPLNTYETGACVPLCFNIGNISGIQNILTDYHLLQAYRRFSQKILGTEGHWDVMGETDSGGPGAQKIRLYPTPKGVFPVVVLYMPVVTHFRSPQAKLLAHEMLEAETKEMVGMVRRKVAGIPMPDGGALALDGEAMVNEGKEQKERVLEKAILLGEPLGVFKWGLMVPLFLSLAGSLLC